MFLVVNEEDDVQEHGIEMEIESMGKGEVILLSGGDRLIVHGDIALASTDEI